MHRKNSPDKREVFLKNEKEVLQALGIHVGDFFENIQRVKAYEEPGGERGSKSMDLLDCFKKSTSPMQQANADTGATDELIWTKKRPITQISNTPGKNLVINSPEAKPKGNNSSSKGSGSAFDSVKKISPNADKKRSELTE